MCDSRTRAACSAAIISTFQRRLSQVHSLKMRFEVELTSMVLGTGSNYRGGTLSFDFLSHGYRFTTGTIWYDSRQEFWRFCRHLTCSTCLKSPRAFVVHEDCAKLRKRDIPTETLSHMWLLGSWCHPSLGAYQDTLICLNLLDATAEAMTHLDLPKTFRIMVERSEWIAPRTAVTGEFELLVTDYATTISHHAHSFLLIFHNANKPP
jgi:hypothetical protein